MFISPETKSCILEELGKPSADIHRISRQYGVPVRIIRGLVAPERPAQKFRQQFGGYGRPELQGFIISRTRAGDPWPAVDLEEITRAHQKYDAGDVEICQGRDGEWVILYSIPRRERDKERRVYFSRVFNDE